MAAARHSRRLPLRKLVHTAHLDTWIRVDQNQLTPVHAAALGALLTNASRIAGGTDR